MIRIKRFAATFCSALATLLLSGCNVALLNPKGIIAAEQKQLLIVAVSLMLCIVIPVIVLTLLFAWRYRASNHKAGYHPNWTHSTALEVVCWTVPFVIVFILSVLAYKTAHSLDPYKPLAAEAKTKALPIQVVALDWKWLFIYPEQHIATVNEVAFPVDVPISFSITSDAPMNSFAIPQLAGQIYAMAGMKTQLHLMATEIGEYRGFSANYTGNGFAHMNFKARVLSQTSFDAWVEQVRQAPSSLTADIYQQLAVPSENNPVQYFSSVKNDLFDEVVMKFMMPMPDSVSTEQDASGQGKQ